MALKKTITLLSGVTGSKTVVSISGNDVTLDSASDVTVADIVVTSSATKGTWKEFGAIA